MGCVQSAKGNIKLNKRNIPEALGHYNISDKKLVKIYQKYCQQNGVIVRDIAAPEEQNNFSSIFSNEDCMKRQQIENIVVPSYNYSKAAAKYNNSSNNIKENQQNNFSQNIIHADSVRKVNNESSQQLISNKIIQNNKMNNNYVFPNESEINSFHENPKIIRNLHLNKLYLKRKIQIHNDRFIVQQGCA